MKNSNSLVVAITKKEDLTKIDSTTKYINLDLANCNSEIISYFIDNGSAYYYGDLIDDIKGYIYVNYTEFLKAETIIGMIFANMPSSLDKLSIAKYLYISIAKLLSYDINLEENKNENYNLSLVNNINNLWGSISSGRVNSYSATKIYYYLCQRLNIPNKIIHNTKADTLYNELKIDNQILDVNLYKDIPYIEANMQTRYFATYNTDILLDRKIRYIKKNYNDYYLDKSLKDIDYLKEDCLKDILAKTEKVLDLNTIKPAELAIIMKDIFEKYCPNYDIQINNLYINNQNKFHFIIISYNNIHYSYNYKKKNFVKINSRDIFENLKEKKICLYQNELIPNINV